MIPYRTQEADLFVPTDWTDQSLTVFKLPGPLGARDASFVLSRDNGKGSQPFVEYIAQQLKQCREKLPGFSLRKNERFTFQEHAAAWLEFTWRNDHTELFLRQVFYDRGSQALICTLTTSEADLKHHDRAWRRVMAAMVLRPPPEDTADEPPPFPPASGSH